METKNKIVRYSESFRTDSEIKEPWHYKSMERTVDGVYVVPEIYIPLSVNELPKRRRKQSVQNMV